MKVYITTRFKGAKENKLEVEKLCAAVKSAGMIDFNFVRDVENYEHTFDDLRELWRTARQKIEECDALLIDISDFPSGGRVVEAGIAYALKKPIFVIAKRGTERKGFYDGIADLVIEYDDVGDIVRPLREYSVNS
jgi:nucleoside 2-deoxyribosyltransferase